MTRNLHWDPCVSHRAEECQRFIQEYFRGGQKVLLVCGAGFDPRSTVVAASISSAMKSDLDAVLIRERRDGDGDGLFDAAEENEEALLKLIPNAIPLQIDIFSGDGAVIGGREAVKVVSDNVSLSTYTDVIIDFSALSNGVSFPLTRWAFEMARGFHDELNVHIMAAASPAIDRLIISSFADGISPIHGFQGEYGLESRSESAVLWLPQLATEQLHALRRLHEDLKPSDTCPILPFPTDDPRTGDQLLQEFTQELLRTWDVDPGNVIYAADNDPLDMYRAIVSTDAARQTVFDGVGGAFSIVSPVGSKVLSIGALLAALDRNLPLYYVESVGYRVSAGPDRDNVDSDLIHIWLSGMVYRDEAKPES